MKPLYEPLGIADLKVIKQRLVKYEAGEVAHVETVMAHEARSRKHRRLRQDEATVVSTEEREEESRRDLQSTERFELEHEVQSTLKSEQSFKAGVDLSGTFGPVSLSTYVKYDYSISKEESDRLATKYAKEVTDKSLTRLLEKTSVQRTQRTLEEIEEVNKHSFENSTGISASGVYRWLDKIYRAKVVDYGKRLFYEFVVPEPAAFLVMSRAYKHQLSNAPKPPDPPIEPLTRQPLTAAHLDAGNYRLLTGQYAAEGVKPPPAEYIMLARSIAHEFVGQSFSFSESELKIPKDYVAVSYYVTVCGVRDASLPYEVSSFVGLQQQGQLTLPDELRRIVGTLPTAAIGYNVLQLLQVVVVFCQLSWQAFQTWQLETFSAIMQAYRKQVADYEDKLAAQSLQAVQIGGRNPLLNRATEREELRRACLSMWTWDALPVPPGIWWWAPFVILPAEAKMLNERVKFFESAFDWENMTYEFLPYFWGSLPRWMDLMSLEDPDPIFEKFLNAGAAKVRVPVQLGAAEHVLFYQHTGVFVASGPVPLIGPPGDPEADLYNSYIAELGTPAAIDDITRDVPIEKDDPDTWLIRVPTTLIWLQPDSTLPNFEQ